MRTLVDQNAIHPENVSRIIPHLSLGKKAQAGRMITFQSRYAGLDREIGNLSESSGLGVSIDFDYQRQECLFCVRQGTDRSCEQEERSPVIFCMDYDTIESRTCEISDMDAKTCAVIAGKGERAATKLAEWKPAEERLISEVWSGGRQLYQYDSTAPSLTVAAPAGMAENAPSYWTSGAAYRVQGSVTDADSGVAAVYVNGKEAVVSGSSWYGDITLTVDTTVAVQVYAVDKAGNRTGTITRYVRYDSMAPAVSLMAPAGIWSVTVNGDGSDRGSQRRVEQIGLSDGQCLEYDHGDSHGQNREDDYHHQEGVLCHDECDPGSERACRHVGRRSHVLSERYRGQLYGERHGVRCHGDPERDRKRSGGLGERIKLE